MLVGVMETSVSERIFTAFLTLVTFGSVAALIYLLITTESTSMPIRQVLTEQKS